MRAFKVLPDGTHEIVDISNLDGFQAAVGGHIQCLPFIDGCDAYVNDDGKAMGLAPNESATAMCFAFNIGMAPGDYVVGNLLVVGPADDEGENTDVPETLIEKMADFLSTK